MDRTRDSHSKIQIVGKAIVAVFCVIIATIAATILLGYYKPNQNALGALASVCMDTICLIILFIMIISYVYEQNRSSRTGQLFLTLLLGTLVAMFFDFLTWSFDGSLVYEGWTYTFTVTSLCCGSLLAAIFVLYLCSYLDDMYELNSVMLHGRVCVIINLVAFVVTVFLAATRNAFLFTNGHYETGALYDVVTAIPVLTLVYMTMFSIRHIKLIGLHDLIAVTGYIFMMIVGALIETEYRMGTTYVSVVLADIFIYVMLQNKFIDSVQRQVDVEKENAEKWMQKSNMDEMTGFYNRHAYEEEMAILKKTVLEDNFVYVSADVNGLKMVNDTLGHEAGDELIIGACECLRQCFGSYGKLYRTGGDEFVALIYADDNQLKEIKRDLEEVTEKWKGKLNESLTVSCGYVTQKQADRLGLHQIAVLADKKMYEAKSKYYRKKGIDRRGQRDAHVALCALYYKILKINVTDDTYQIINMNEEEQNSDMGFSDKISEWLHDFATSGNVHPEDLEYYLEKTNIDYLRNYFIVNRNILWLTYRRKYGDDYKSTVMEIIPANDYHNSSQNLFLYVKTIE